MAGSHEIYFLVAFVGSFLPCCILAILVYDLWRRNKRRQLKQSKVAPLTAEELDSFSRATLEIKAIELQNAIAAEEVERLAAALADAHKVPVCQAELMEKAAEVLRTLRHRYRLDVTLRKAIRLKDMTRLARCLATAREAGVSSSLVAEGAQLLQASRDAEGLASRRKMLEDDLRDALARKELDLQDALCKKRTLEGLVSRASACGVADPVLQEVQARIEHIQQRAKIEESMREAMTAGDLESIDRCLSESMETTCGFDVVQEAEALLTAMERGREIEIDLQAALLEENVEAIRKQLAAAKVAKVSPDLVREAEAVLHDLHESEERLMKAVHAGDVVLLRMSLASVRPGKFLKDLVLEARQLENELSREFLEGDLQHALDAGDFAQLFALHKRAKALRETDSPLYMNATEVLSSRRFSHSKADVHWAKGSWAAPRGKVGWISNPIIEISIAGGASGLTDISVCMEDLDAPQDGHGDAKCGFTLLGNPNFVNSTCPVFVPGAPVLGEATYGRSGVAATSIQLCTGVGQTPADDRMLVSRVFALPSLLGPVQRGGSARFHVFSKGNDVTVRLLSVPDELWSFQTSLEGQWLSGRGGPFEQKEAWFSNPHFQVNLEEQGRCHIVALLRILHPSGQKPVLHAIQNTSSPSQQACSAAAKPQKFEVLAESCYSLPHSQSKQETAVYLEIDAQAGPFFLVPSFGGQVAEAPAGGGNFELQVVSTHRLSLKPAS